MGGFQLQCCLLVHFRFLVWAELLLIVWAELLLLCPLPSSVACVCYCPDSIRMVSGYFSLVCAIYMY